MKLKRLLSLLLCLVLTAALAITPVSAATYTDKLQELADIIKEYGLTSSEDDDPIMRALEQYFTDHPEAFDKFADDMFQMYDPYSHYFSKEDYAVNYPTSAGYVGIGVELDENRSGGNFIKTVFAGSPAEAVGLLKEDEIVSVDGTDVTGYSISGLSAIIRGVAGTDVVVGIRRNNAPAVTYYTITRAAIALSNIQFKDLGDGVAYLRILSFGDLTTFFDFANIYVKLPYQGFRSVIFDVRDNPGGSLEVLLNILNYIIPDEEKEMITIRTRGDVSETYRSTGIGWKPNKIVVLANGNSASAAEVFTGTLQNLGYAEVIGTTTYGKGVGQYHLPLEDESVAIVTTFEIMLAGQESYNGTGVVPDRIVEIGKEPYPMPALGKLSYLRSIRVGEVSADVLELEKRLSLLGYLSDTPDETFDARTLYAVNAFQKDFDLKVVSSASGNMIYHLNLQIDKLAKSTVFVDTQLEMATRLAKEAAKNPLSYTLPPLPSDEE